MPLGAQDAAERRNWFKDPYFQIAAQAPRCRRRVVALQAWATGVPDVEPVLANASTRPNAQAPYRTLRSP